MKISNLTIKNYKQFKDLTLDLTYPKGHEKEGQPLDKICIIGQSGTGKTNLLDIIKKSTVDFSKYKETYKPFKKFIGKKSENQYILTEAYTKNENKLKILFSNEGNEIESTNIDSEKSLLEENEKNYFLGVKIDLLSFNSEDFEDLNMTDKDRSLYEKLQIQKKLLLLRTNILENTFAKNSISSLLKVKKEESSELEIINKHIKVLESKYSSNDKGISTYLKKVEERNYFSNYIIDVNNNSDSWEILKKRIDRYKEEEQEQQNIIFNRVLNDSNYTKENSIQDMKSWQSKNENLLENISSDINKILNKFNLELTKIDENQKNYNSLTIKDLSNETIIEYDDLSTGTKNLLSTFIPLKSFSPKDSIILIDEPEMSFYPDIQKKLVDLYMNVGENNQLVLATHSPIIASSFEPWEIVELKFDEDNHQIKREKYFEGEENHVDNYTLDPRMLTWTGILTDIFDLKEDSNFTIREEALMQYATLKSEIKMIDDIEEKERKFKELQKLSKKLGLEN